MIAKDTRPIGQKTGKPIFKADIEENTVVADIVDGPYPMRKMVSILLNMSGSFSTYNNSMTVVEATFDREIRKVTDIDKLNFKLDEETQSVKELWHSLADVVTGRVRDNEDGNYPILMRIQQLVSIQALVTALFESHIHLLNDGTQTEFDMLMHKVLNLLPEAELDESSDGEIIIHTKLQTLKDGSLQKFEPDSEGEVLKGQSRYPNLSKYIKYLLQHKNDVRPQLTKILDDISSYKFVAQCIPDFPNILDYDTPINEHHQVLQDRALLEMQQIKSDLHLTRIAYTEEVEEGQFEELGLSTHPLTLKHGNDPGICKDCGQGGLCVCDDVHLME